MKINEVSLEHKSLIYDNKPQYLILHHAACNGSVEDINRIHRGMGWSMIGYNYYVRKNGTIWRGRPEKAIGANCYGYNNKSISICAEGNFMTDKMSDVQKNSIIKLEQNIQKRYNNKLKIMGHKELYATACPGNNYPLEEIKNKIKSGDDSMHFKRRLEVQRGQDVEVIQKILYRLGLISHLTGFYDMETRAAIVKYQSTHSDLSKTGIVDKATYKSLMVHNK